MYCYSFYCVNKRKNNLLIWVKLIFLKNYTTVFPYLIMQKNAADSVKTPYGGVLNVNGNLLRQFIFFQKSVFGRINSEFLFKIA